MHYMEPGTKYQLMPLVKNQLHGFDGVGKHDPHCALIWPRYHTVQQQQCYPRILLFDFC